MVLSRGRSVPVIAAVCISLVSAGSLFADNIYRCVDKNGAESYTNQRDSEKCTPVAGGKEPAGSGNGAEENPFLKELSDASERHAPPVSSISMQMESALRHGSGLTRFYARLKQLEKKEISAVTVFHIGDSHVSSGPFPRRLAALLQSRFGAAGGDFCHTVQKKVYPVARKTRTVKKSARNASANKPKRHVRTIYLPQNRFYEQSAGQIGRPMPIQPRRALVYSRENRSTEKPDPAPERVVVSQPAVISDLMCKPSNSTVTNSADGLKYYVYGNSGKTFSWFAAYQDLARQLREYKPDLIIITLGTNDAFARLEYETAFRSVNALMDVIRSVSPESSVLFTTPPDSFFRNGQNNPYINSMRRLLLAYSESHGYAAWDFTAKMGGTGSMNKWLMDGYANPDRIHLNSKGYSMKGELLYKELIDGYGGYRASR